MSDKDNQSKTNIKTGNVQGGNVNIGGNQTFHGSVNFTMGNLISSVEATNGFNQEEKVKIEELLAELEVVLKKVDAEKEGDAKVLIRRTDELVSEAAQPNPDKQSVADKSNALKRAAETIKEAIPLAFPIAITIVEHFLKFASR